MNLETVAAAAYGRWVELSVFAGFAQADDHLEWSQLPDHKTVSWFAVARALGTPEPYPDKTLTVELEAGPRAMMTAGGTPVVGPVNPDNKTVTLRRPTGKDLPRGVSFSLSDAWGTWAPLLVECSDRDRDEIGRVNTCAEFIELHEADESENHAHKKADKADDWQCFNAGFLNV